MHEKTLLYSALALTTLAAGFGVYRARHTGGEAESNVAITPIVLDDASRTLAQAEVPIRLTASDGTGLRLASLRASAAVEDPLALTELHLVFENPEDRVVEGTFRITLPQGASLSRFAMKVGSTWQEGEVVERQAARQAYEDFLHRRQDPALMEQGAGNEFSARVFPIPARGTKEIVIAYSEVLEAGAPYVLPLRGLPMLGALDVDVRAAGARTSSASFGVHQTRFTPGQDFVVPAKQLPRSAGLRAGELAIARVVPFATSRPDPVGSAIVLVDTSASRGLGLAEQAKLVRSVLAKLPPDAQISVACFDQEVAKIYEGKAGGFGDAETKAILARGALGASDIERAIGWAADAAKRAKAARVVLVGDGVATAGETDAQKLRDEVASLRDSGVVRFDAVAVGGVRDDAFLRTVVRGVLDKDGVVLDGKLGADAIARRLGEATSSGVPVKVEGARWSWPEKLDGLQAGDEVMVYAELDPALPTKITIGTEQFTPDLRAADRPLVERAWAQAKIQSLIDAPTEDAATTRRKIIQLSTRHRVISPYTAMLVLETDRDYARFGIDRNANVDILTVQDGRVAVLHESRDWAEEEQKELAKGRGEDETKADEKTVAPKREAKKAEAAPAQATPPSTGAPAGATPTATATAASNAWAPTPAASAPPTTPVLGGVAGDGDALAQGDLREQGAAAVTGKLGAIGGRAEPPPPPPAPPNMVARRPTSAGLGNAGPATTSAPALEPPAEPLGGLSGAGQGGGGLAAGGAPRSRLDENRPAPAPRPSLDRVDPWGGEGQAADDAPAHGARGLGAGFGSGSSSGAAASPHEAERAVAQVRPGTLVVEGGIAEPEVQRVLRSAAPRLRACYTRDLARDPTSHGRLEVRVVIGKDGDVKSADVTRAPTSPLGACSATALRALRFPAPGTGDARFTATFDFVGGGPGVGSNAVAENGAHVPQASPYEGRFKTVMDDLADGDADTALDEAKKWHDDQPGDEMALVALGEAYEAKGELSTAARAYGSIVDLFSFRADSRRFAGERLERLDDPGAARLAIDTYEKAVEQRPDHPAGHRLYAYALLKHGDYERAFEAMKAGATRAYPPGRFLGADRILKEDLGLIAAAWEKAEPARRSEIVSRLHAAGGTEENGPSLRFVLVWETDSNDVDFHIYDARGQHAYYASKTLPSGGQLYADVTTGYGPECFTIRNPPAKRAYPYTLQAHYYSRGPMGYGMGKLEIVEHDGHGGLTFEERPFVVMKDHAFVDMGKVDRALGNAQKTALK